MHAQLAPGPGTISKKAGRLFFFFVHLLFLLTFSIIYVSD